MAKSRVRGRIQPGALRCWLSFRLGTGISLLGTGRQLVRDGNSWFVILPAGETKTGTAIEFAVPEVLGPYLVTYLDIARPRMLRRPDCTALWVSPKGGALSYSAIWDIISRHTVRSLGIHIAPHDARDRGNNLGYCRAGSDRHRP